MHTGSRAFCILMALATAGAETDSVFASADTGSGPAVQSGHYRVEANILSVSGAPAKDLGDETAESTAAHIDKAATVSTSIPASAQPLTGYDGINVPVPQKPSATYDADGRVSTSVADANERQLLFVKISRG